FRDPAKMKQIVADHDQYTRRWETIRDDLRSLRPFKERLATFRLIQHMHDWVARMLEKSRADKKTERETTERISQIVSGCNTDMETGRLLVPQKFAKEYPELLEKRDNARHELAQLADHARRAIGAIQARINNVELRGSAELPQVLLLGALPEAWPKLVPQMSDSAIGDRLGELGGPLKAELKPVDWLPAPAAAPKQPASDHGEQQGRPQTPDRIPHKDQLPPAPPVDGEAVD
ncbi:MAG: hypothetical protein ABSH20_28770, partial [Tepidisphaeraceae bacterium]